MKLHAYVLRQLLVAFTIAAGGILFVALPGIAVGVVHRLAGVGTVALVKYMPLMVAAFVPYVLPIAFLLALVATYGRLAADNEWTAIRMAGINPYRMLWPAVALGTTICGGVYFLNSEALPWLRYQQKALSTLLLRDVVKNLSPGHTDISYGPFYLTAQDRDPRDPSTFLDVFIEFPDPTGEGRKSAFAERARFEFDADYMRVHLKGVRGANPTGKGEVAELEFAYPLEKLLEAPREDYSSPRYKDSGQLLASMSDPALTDEQRRNLAYTFHERMASAATCLMFVFLGVPTGILMRRGTQLAALAVAVGYAILYWISSMRLGDALSGSGALPAEIGAWGPLALWTVGALFLTRRAFAQ